MTDHAHGWSSNGGGGGVTTNVDSTARANATAAQLEAADAKAIADANKAKMDVLYPPSGAAVKKDSQPRFVVNGVDSVYLATADTTVPATLTESSLAAANFVPFGGGSGGNSQFYFATRGDNSTAPPTVADAPTSELGDTCDIKLANLSTLKYRHDGNSWILLRTDVPSGADGNQRFFPITRTTNSTAAPTKAEIDAANGTPYTPQDGDTAKVVNNRRSVVWYTHDGTSWGTGQAEADTPNALTRNITRADNAIIAPSAAEVTAANYGRDLQDGDILNVRLNNDAVMVFTRVSGAWDVGFELMPPPVIAGVDAADSWVSGQSYAADELSSIRIPATGAFVDASGNNLVNGGLYNIAYPAPQTSGATFDVAEAAKVHAVLAPVADAPTFATTIRDAATATDHAAPTELATRTAIDDAALTTRTSVRDLANAKDDEFASEKAVRTAIDNIIPDQLTDTQVVDNTDGTFGLISGEQISAAIDKHVAGLYLGRSNKFATLPVGNAARQVQHPGDFVILTADDGTNKRGGYVSDGTDYSLAFAIGDTVATLTDTQAGDRTNTTPGMVSGKQISTSIEAQVRGLFMGSANTYAGLPVSNLGRSALPGDVAILSVDEIGTGTVSAPQWPKGLYAWAGTAYALRYTLASNQAGVFIGSGSAFAALPTTGADGRTAVIGDWVLLTAHDVGTGTPTAPQHPRGIYTWVGGSYSLTAALANLNFGGSYLGSAGTFAALPAQLGTQTRTIGDWVFLSADDGANVRGGYTWNGRDYVFSWASPLALPPTGFVHWNPEFNLSTNLNALHATGVKRLDFVKASSDNVIQLPIGTIQTADDLLAALGLNGLTPTRRVVRRRAGTTDAFVNGGSTIGTGIYLLRISGINVLMDVVESSDGTANSTIVYTGANPPNPPFTAQGALGYNNTTRQIDRSWNPATQTWDVITSVADPSIAVPWAANAAVVANEIRTITINGVTGLGRNRGGVRATAANFTEVEAAQWDVFGQNGKVGISTNTVYPRGWEVWSGSTGYKAFDTLRTPAAIDATHLFDFWEITNLTQISQRIWYHTGTPPAAPTNIAPEAIAINTTTNRVSHRWNAGTWQPLNTPLMQVLTGTTTADAGAGVGVLTNISYTVPAGMQLHSYEVTICDNANTASGSWYKENFNPAAESAWRFRTLRASNNTIRIFTTPDTNVTSTLNNRPYRVALTFIPV